MDRGGHRSDVHSLVNTVPFFISHNPLRRRAAVQRCAEPPRESCDGAGGEAAGQRVTPMHPQAPAGSAASTPPNAPAAGSAPCSRQRQGRPG